ncbi:MAG TPA: F0F1 ATP synthase subunit delta [Candidatus Paceibacterota bacterium]|nr:F0F1 ATP synthase subunit delta [Candidatus Paceibacterota bacterium]
METAYAQALFRIIESGKKPDAAIAMLKKELQARGRSALLPKIARAFARLADREARRNTMTLSIARQKDAKAALKEAEKILAAQHITKTELCEVVDEHLIGGWRLEGRGLLVDRSWKKSLLSMYNRATS